MQEIAYAKINLALHVRAREADGYHRIETLFAFCEDGDILIADEADTLSLDVTGPFAGALAGDEDNLILEAARALGRTAAFTLDKRLPVAAGLCGGAAPSRANTPLPVAGGLGGGSADAAAALRMLGGGADVAARLGADVPACLLS